MNENIKNKVKTIRLFSILTFILVLIFIGMLILYVNVNNTSVQSISNNQVTIINVTSIAIEEIAYIKPIINNIARDQWDANGRIENLFQKRIRDWKIYHKLENYNWFSMLNCHDRKSFVKLTPWRVYEDVLIFEIDDKSGDFKTMWQHRNKDIECFQDGLSLNCTKVFCFTESEVNKTE